MEESCRGVRLTWIQRPNNNRPAEQLSADVENSPLSDWYNKSMHLAMLCSLSLCVCTLCVSQLQRFPGHSPVRSRSMRFATNVRRAYLISPPLCCRRSCHGRLCFAILTFMFTCSDFQPKRVENWAVYELKKSNWKFYVMIVEMLVFLYGCCRRWNWLRKCVLKIHALSALLAISGVFSIFIFMQDHENFQFLTQSRSSYTALLSGLNNK